MQKPRANDHPAALWAPDLEAAERCAMARFIQIKAGAADCINVDALDYSELHTWSVKEPAAFWQALADFCGVQFSRPAERVLTPAEHMAEARWFAGAELNYARQLLAAERTGPALVFCDEAGGRHSVSTEELRDQVLRVAASLGALGLQPGDRVAAILPNCPEAVIAYLACAAIGLIFSSCSPDFGAAAIVARFGQITPRVLIGCDGYRYGGKAYDCRAGLADVRAALPSVEHYFEVPFMRLGAQHGESPQGFDELLATRQHADFVELPFAHPLCILFSSGTTGKPKCIVHSAGGTLLQHLKEQALHCDLSRDDRLLYFTTCGWMMWNWQVSALATGATLVLYEGAPLLPTALAFWQLVQRERVSVFGTSPKFLSASAKQHPDLGQHLDAPALRTVLSTGAPLGAHCYDFIAEQFEQRVQLCSISGGTDIISCFALGNPLQPVYRGEIQGPGLGMAVAVVDDDGQPTASQLGELVCMAAFPSMPLGFWNDPDKQRFHAAYFERFPGCWRQGDLARWTRRGGIEIVGRADATLNPGGVRMGSAELCDPALTLHEVAEALAVSYRQAGDERVVMFVVLRADCSMSPELEARIKARIRERASPRHVPALVKAVPDLPRTRSGKVMELAVRALIHGREPTNLEGLANPVALRYFRECL